MCWFIWTRDAELNWPQRKKPTKLSRKIARNKVVQEIINASSVTI